MRCSHCANEVAADFQFCPKCGNRLSLSCPKCGHACPPEFLYCPRCGTKIATSSPVVSDPPVADRHLTQADTRRPETSAQEVAEAERRPVTVLFADVVGFTSLADRLDPESSGA